jgi:hypothetical protein
MYSFHRSYSVLLLNQLKIDCKSFVEFELMIDIHPKSILKINSKITKTNFTFLAKESISQLRKGVLCEGRSIDNA